jgi:translation initiation factor IF-1/putative component of toxin-antitoxin plasmid stabilization module
MKSSFNLLYRSTLALAFALALTGSQSGIATAQPANDGAALPRLAQAGERYNRENTRITGVVTREPRNDEFEIRSDDGRRYLVTAERRDIPRLRAGDRVEVIGRLNGNTLEARTILRTGGGTGGDNFNTVLRGTVVSQVNDSSLELRAEDDRFYRVRPRFGALRRFSIGDRVEARGEFDRDRIFVADTIVMQGSGDTGNRVTRRGTIVNIVDAAVFEMRGDDGTAYRVQAPFRAQRSTAPVVRLNDRVEVTGYFDRDRILIAENVQLLGNSSGGGDVGTRITRRGTVINIVDAAVFEMRGDDGTAYRVSGTFRAQRSTAPVVRLNDRVEVTGYFDRDRILIAENVQLLGNTSGGGDVGTRITRRGTVINIVDAAVFEMRGDDGTAYRVSGTFRAQRSTAPVVRLNDRVEVSGYFDRDRIIIAENVRLIGKGDDDSSYGNRVTRRGTVVNLVDAYTFEIRGEDNKFYRMRQNTSGITRVRVGDRVEVRGYTDRDQIVITESVRVIGRDDNDTNDRATLRGTVVTLIDANTFEMRGDDNKYYRMRTSNGEARRLTVGDRVEVSGYFDRDRILITERVQVIGRGNTGSERGDNEETDFTGTVLRADRVLVLWVLQVRSDDNRQYQVNYSGNNTFAANDRVRVVGTFRRGTIVSNNVTRIR